MLSALLILSLLFLTQLVYLALQRFNHLLVPHLILGYCRFKLVEFYRLTLELFRMLLDD
jgi:hypothetical protein